MYRTGFYHHGFQGRVKLKYMKNQRIMKIKAYML